MNLVESVERIVVSALAQQDWAAFNKYSSHVSKTPINEPEGSVVTRNIILKVVEKMEEMGSRHFCTDWLRSQASAGTQATITQIARRATDD